MGGTKTGTYKYMAPEVYNNQPYGQQADIYSLGLVLYWLLNKRRMPFMPLPPQKLTAGMDEQARSRRLAGESLPSPVDGREELKKIVLKACAYNPTERYHTADEMLQALRSIKTNAASATETDFAKADDDTKGTETANDTLEERTTGVFATEPQGETETKTAITVENDAISDNNTVECETASVPEEATVSAAYTDHKIDLTRSAKENTAIEKDSSEECYRQETDEADNEPQKNKSSQKQKHKKRMVICVSAILGVLAVALSISMIIKNQNARARAESYAEALKLMQNGDYARAKENFSALGDYQDAAEMVRRCDYEYALSLLDDEEYEKAEEIFSSLGDYNLSKTQRLVCLASISIQEGRLSDAAEYIEQITNENTKETVSEKLAAAYFENEDYENARTWFIIARHGEMAKESIYQQALGLMNSGEKLAAAKLFKQLSQYKDAEDLRYSCVMDAATWLLENNNYLDALCAIEQLTLRYYSSPDDPSVQLREVIIEQLKAYNKNHGLLRNPTALLGRWESDRNFYFDIQYNSEGVP